MKSGKPFFVFWSLMSILAIVNLLVFDLSILLSPETTHIQYTPDDTYYYLQLAKNFASFGQWTFDSGVSTTTGFHPLLAYLLVLLYRVLKPGADSFVLYDILFSSALSVFTGVYLWQKSLKVQNVYFFLFSALFISTQGFLFNSVTGVEWAIVVMLASIYCFTFYESDGARNSSTALFIIGLLLSLARTDSGLLPLAVFLASSALTTPGLRKSSSTVRSSLAGLLGACTGVGLVFLHNYWFTGNFLQSSAQMKLFWSQFHPFRVNLVLRALGFDIYFKGTLSHLQTPFLVLLLIILLGIIGTREYSLGASSSFTWLKQKNNRGLVLSVASVLCVSGYAILYLYDGVIQNWYTANIQIPIFIFSVGTTWYLQKYFPRAKNLTLIIFSAIALATILFNFLSTYPVDAHGPWPHQQFMLTAGRYLKMNPPNGRVGAWNAGIIGYYEGGHVINLDGLANNDIYSYAVRNDLPSYLKEKDITFIIDFEPMFTTYAKRGGYNNPIFLRRLEPLIQFDQGQFTWKFLTLYRIRNSLDR